MVRVLGSNGPFYYIQRGHSRTSFLDKFSVRDIRREVGPGWVGPLNNSQYLSYKNVNTVDNRHEEGPATVG